MSTIAKAYFFVTHSIPNSSGIDDTPAQNGIDNDAVSLGTAITHDLVDGNTQPACFNPANYTPGGITFDAPLQTYYTYMTYAQGSTFYGEIHSGSTVTGTLTPTVLYNPLSISQINDFYTGFVNGIVDDPIAHKLYFTQQVLDEVGDVVSAQR